MARIPLSFAALDKAFWAHVERQCPHPLHSRHRYTWVRANQRFTYDGIAYERRGITARSAAGRAVHIVSYTTPDGSVIQAQLEAQPLTA